MPWKSQRLPQRLSSSVSVSLFRTHALRIWTLTSVLHPTPHCHHRCTYNLNCWHPSHAEVLTWIIQCSLELMVWCPSLRQWIASGALWQSSFASSITRRCCRRRRSDLVSSVTPRRSDLVLVSHVSHGETQVLVLHWLGIGNGSLDWRCLCAFTWLTLLDERILVRSSTWSSTCVCSSVSPCLDLTSSDQHWSRASWSSSSLSSSTFPLFNLHSRFVTRRRHRFLRIWVMELLDRKRVTVPLPGLFGHSDFLFSFLNFCFSLVFFLLSFLNVSLYSRFSLIWLSFFCHLFSPFTYLPVIPKSTFFWTISVFAVSLFFFWKKKRNGFFSYFLSFPLHYKFFSFFHWKFVLTFFETSAFFQKKKLFTFTSTNATRSLFERLLCLLTLSFCSSSIHLFSFFGPSVFSRFFHLFFALLNFSLVLDVPLFSLSITFLHIFESS